MAVEEGNWRDRRRAGVMYGEGGRSKEGTGEG